MTVAVDAFEEHRTHLVSVAYRMLGCAAEAEDVVQEAYLRWEREAESARSARALLTTITTRLSIDRLRSAQRRRESYVGPWLPEPIVTGDDAYATVELADSLTFAFLLLLERLNPVERAVFVLREVFAYDYEEVAVIVGRTEANCRQILSRAKKRISLDEQPRGRDVQRGVVEQFLVALSAGDVDTLLELIAHDAVLVSDGGPDHRAARRPITGPQRITRLLTNLRNKMPEGYAVRMLSVNAEPTMVIDVDGKPAFTMTISTRGERVDRIYVVVNPDKLTRV